MAVYDIALVRQQERRRAFLAERNFYLKHGLFILANAVFWLHSLIG